jgi:hypothetical protein
MRARSAPAAHLRGAQHKDVVPHGPQPRQVELESDDEQKQHDAELGDLHDLVAVGKEAEPKRSDDQTRGQVAEDGAVLEAPKQGHGDHRRREKDQGLDVDGCFCVLSHGTTSWVVP